MSDLKGKVLVDKDYSAMWISLQRIEPFIEFVELDCTTLWTAIREQFAREVANADVCWEWFGWIDKNGYGIRVWNQRFYKIHVLAFEFWKGKIPRGMVVMHECDNRKCFNPKHLFLGTRKENSQDMIRKGRGKHQIPPSKKATVVCKLSRTKLKRKG